MSTIIKLIVGLGNPGAGYANTRHNAGADFVTALTRQHSQMLTPDSKFFGLRGRISVSLPEPEHRDTEEVNLLVPSTFMNLSGKAVAAIARFYKIEPEQILIAHDELDLAPGTARLKAGGGHGGHKGLKDIMASLGNNRNFARLRIGIGHPGNARQVSDYVLCKAPADEQQRITDSFDNALRVLPSVVAGEWDRAVRDLHTASAN